MLEEKLIKLRKKQGYSQQEVADLLSVTRQTISNWECGQATPALDKAAELARLYHVSMDDLVGNDVEIVLKEEKDESTNRRKDHHLLQMLIGKRCVIDCDDMSLVLDLEGYTKPRVLDVNEEWIRVEYERRKENPLRQRETVVKLIEMSAVKGFQIMEDE